MQKTTSNTTGTNEKPNLLSEIPVLTPVLWLTYIHKSATRVPQRHKTLISAPTTDNGTPISILMRLGTSLGDYRHPFIKSKARPDAYGIKSQRKAVVVRSMAASARSLVHAVLTTQWTVPEVRAAVLCCTALHPAGQAAHSPRHDAALASLWGAVHLTHPMATY